MAVDETRHAPDLSPRSMGRILDRAFGLYRANFRTVAGAAMIVVFAIALLAGMAQTFYARGAMVFFRDIFTAPGTAPPEPELGTIMELQLWAMLANVLALPMWIARIYIEACIYATAGGMLYGEKYTIRQFLRAGRGRFLWYALLSFLISMLSGFYFLIVPLVFVAGWALAPLMAVTERADFEAAFRRSWRLTLGSKWRVVGFYLVLGAFTIVLQATVTSPMVLRQIVASLQNPQAVFEPISVGWKVMEGLLSAMAATLVPPFVAFAWYSFYLDMRARREGMDLVVAASEVEKR